MLVCNKLVSQQAEKQRQESENRAFIAYFEGLSPDEQERITDEVEKRIPSFFKAIWAKARTQQDAHKNQMLRQYFKQVMGF